MAAASVRGLLAALLAAWVAAQGASEDPSHAPLSPDNITAWAAAQDEAMRTLRGQIDALQAQLQAMQEKQSEPRCYISRSRPSASESNATAAVGEGDDDDSLHAAAARDDAAAVRRLLAGGARVGQRDARGDTALHAAARAGAASAAEVLLDGGADPHARGALLRTPLHAAAAGGHLAMARRLVKAGASADERDVRGDTPLAFAATAAAARANASVNASSSASSSELFEWLVERAPGDSALLAAARAGRWARVRQLVESGAAPTVRGRDGATALLLAARAPPRPRAAAAEAQAALEAMLREGVCDARDEVARALAEAAGAPQVWALAGAAPDEVGGAAGREAAVAAARDGRCEALGALLLAGVLPKGPEALQLAAQGGHEECVRALLAHSEGDNASALAAVRAAAPDVLRSGFGREVLDEQVVAGRCRVLAALVGTRLPQPHAEALLQLAAEKGRAGCVAPLLQTISSLDERTQAARRLMNATQDASVLAAVGSSAPEAVEAGGADALARAVEEGRCHVVGALVSASASAGAVARAAAEVEARAALRNESRAGRAACVRALRAGGVGPLGGERWEQALRDAARAGRPERVEALLAAGVAVDAPDFAGHTALSLAAIAGRADCVRALLAAGAERSWRVARWQGGTPLMAAALNDRVEVVRVLLAAGVPVDEHDDEGATALFYAARRGHVAPLRELLAAGADVDARNAHGGTALIYAARFKHLDAVRALLAASPNARARDDDDKSALDYAMDNDYQEMQKVLGAYLKEQGAYYS